MTTIEILNLKCGGCANTIKKGLLSVEGITGVMVDLETSIITIDNDDKEVVSSAKKKLSGMGYPEASEANTVLHKAKSFVSCATGRMSSKES